MVPKATVVWSVAEPLAGVNKVGVGEVVQLGDALPAVGSEDAAERFATFDDMHAATRGCGSADSGWCAPVGDDVARIDQVDVAGWCAPYGQWSQAGSLGDAGHGVVVAHGHAHASVGSNRRVCRGFVEPLGDDAHDQFVVRPPIAPCGFLRRRSRRGSSRWTMPPSWIGNSVLGKNTLNAVIRPLLVTSLMVNTAASRLCRPPRWRH